MESLEVNGMKKIMNSLLFRSWQAYLQFAAAVRNSQIEFTE